MSEPTPDAARVGLIIAVLMVAESVSAFEVTMIYAAMPRLVGVFGAPESVGWLITGFMLSSAAGAALCGRLGDLLGRKRMLLLVIAIATFGSILSGLTRDLGLIILGRTLQGASGAILPLCFGLAKELLPPGKAEFGISMLAATATICAGTGLLLGGIIVDHADWPMIFHLCAALGAVAVCLVAVLLPKGRSAPGAMPRDLLGGLMFAPAIVALLLAITNAGKWGWGDMRTIVLLLAGVALFAIWIWRELVVDEPLIDVRLFADRRIALSNIILACIAMTVMQAGYVMSVLGQQDPATGVGLGLSATVIGMVLLVPNISGASMSSFVGGLVLRFGARAVFVSGALLMAVGWAALAFIHDGVMPVVALMIVQGVGLALVYVTLPIVVVTAAPADRTSEATGMLTVTRAAFMGIGAQVIALLLASSTVAGSAIGASLPDEGAFRMTLLYIACGGVFAMCAALAMPRSANPSRVPEE